MTTQFQVGQTYNRRSIVTITITRRTEKSVWFEVDGKEVRRKIQVSGNKYEGLYEYINYDDLYTVDARWSVEPKTTEVIEVAETIETNVADESSEVETIQEWFKINSDTKATEALKASTLTMGDFYGTTTVDNFVKYIKIGWSEGKNVLKPGAKYASVESFIAALKLLESKHNHPIRVFDQIAPTDGQITATSDFHWNFNFYIGGNTKHYNIMKKLSEHSTTLSNWF